MIISTEFGGNCAHEQHENVGRLFSFFISSARVRSHSQNTRHSNTRRGLEKKFSQKYIETCATSASTFRFCLGGTWGDLKVIRWVIRWNRPEWHQNTVSMICHPQEAIQTWAVLLRWRWTKWPNCSRQHDASSVEAPSCKQTQYSLAFSNQQPEMCKLWIHFHSGFYFS